MDMTEVVRSSERFFVDENGEWWCRTKTGRTRAAIGVCHSCGRTYAAFPNRQRIRGHCTRKCYFACRKEGTHPKADPFTQQGENASRWAGGMVNRRGYVLVWSPDHHSIAGRNKRAKYVLQHRIVMEQMLGRPLEAHETVHHKNGVTWDNRPENLELWAIRGQPPGQRASEAAHCPTCTCGHAQ